MSDKTGIEWTDVTWNPTTGCDRISAGCDHCYALSMAKRLNAMRSAKYQTDGDPTTSGPGFGVATHPGSLRDPLKWRKPQRVFVNSMSDLFHARIPRGFVAQVFAVMACAPQHTFQVLTKRPERMARILGDRTFRDSVALALLDMPQPRPGGFEWPMPHVWLGTSVESADHVERVDALRATPATVRFISAEPLLGPLGALDLSGVGWVIVGGESGPNARPMHPDWARSLRDQCTDSSVPYLFKQWGEWGPTGCVGLGRVGPRELLVGEPDGQGFREVIGRTGRSRTGRMLDGRTWDEYPQPVT